MALKAYSQSCTRNVPGNSYLFVTETANVNDVTIVDGEVTDIQMSGSTTFKQIQADKNSVRRRKRRIGRSQAYDHIIGFRCSKPSLELVELSDELADGSPCRMIAIVYDSNGQSWLVGWSEYDKGERGLLLSVDDLDTGENITENNRQLNSYELKTRNAYLELPTNQNINDYIKDSVIAGEDIGFVP